MNSVVPVKPKYVFTASDTPDECVRNAQVLVVGEFSWHVIAPAPFRLHCLLSFAPVPQVRCAVVDVHGVTDDGKMAELIRTCTDPSAGVINLDGLLTGLEALGGKVSRPLTVDGGRLGKKKAQGRKQRVH
jgi:hypothetical protein